MMLKMGFGGMIRIVSFLIRGLVFKFMRMEKILVGALLREVGPTMREFKFNLISIQQISNTGEKKKKKA